MPRWALVPGAVGGRRRWWWISAGRAAGRRRCAAGRRWRPLRCCFDYASGERGGVRAEVPRRPRSGGGRLWRGRGQLIPRAPAGSGNGAPPCKHLRCPEEAGAGTQAAAGGGGPLPCGRGADVDAGATDTGRQRAPPRRTALAPRGPPRPRAPAASAPGLGGGIRDGTFLRAHPPPGTPATGPQWPSPPPRVNTVNRRRPARAARRALTPRRVDRMHLPVWAAGRGGWPRPQRGGGAGRALPEAPAVAAPAGGVPHAARRRHARHVGHVAWTPRAPEWAARSARCPRSAPRPPHDGRGEGSTGTQEQAGHGPKGGRGACWTAPVGRGQPVRHPPPTRRFAVAGALGAVAARHACEACMRGAAGPRQRPIGRRSTAPLQAHNRPEPEGTAMRPARTSRDGHAPGQDQQGRPHQGAPRPTVQPACALRYGPGVVDGRERLRLGVGRR